MEWVELYNDSQNSLELTGYSIHDSTLSNKQILSGTISPQSYLVFSFDHDFLNNSSGDIVKLYDSNNTPIDSQSSKPLPQGLSFSRQSDGTWCPTDSTPNLPNNLCQETSAMTNSPTSFPYISLQITNIDADQESIEITNPNNFSVSLFGWRTVDSSGSSRKLSCASIEANNTCVATFSSGYLNNSSDTITLHDPLKREISLYSYDFKKPSAIKPTPTSKVIVPTQLASPKFINMGGSKDNVVIASRSTSAAVINQSSPIYNYLSIILMFIGSIFILSPLLLHGKNNHK